MSRIHDDLWKASTRLHEALTAADALALAVRAMADQRKEQWPSFMESVVKPRLEDYARSVNPQQHSRKGGGKWEPMFTQ
jgi:hypothetical protein